MLKSECLSKQCQNQNVKIKMSIKKSIEAISDLSLS